MTPMVVQCSSCLTEFELDPDKVPAAGVRARCSVCSAVIAVPAPPPHVAAHAEPAAQAQETHAAAAPSSTPSSTTETVATASAGSEGPQPEPAAHPREAATPPEPEVSQPPLSYASPAAPEAPHAYEPPAAQRVDRASWTVPPPPVRAWSPEPAATPTAEKSASDAGQRRPINPFLTRDPALRAKRLARALVSDIVAYHPARHAEGLRDGSLKTLFRDEIKKSYEEYVDQVGRDFAGSTTHFQDALNDVLASGRKLF
jgi:predicted Zn finger-like uncharacterized protein